MIVVTSFHRRFYGVGELKYVAGLMESRLGSAFLDRKDFDIWFTLLRKCFDEDTANDKRYDFRTEIVGKNRKYILMKDDVSVAAMQCIEINEILQYDKDRKMFFDRSNDIKL